LDLEEKKILSKSFFFVDNTHNSARIRPVKVNGKINDLQFESSPGGIDSKERPSAQIPLFTRSRSVGLSRTSHAISHPQTNLEANSFQKNNQLATAR
jgi:hypothetical protein